MPSLAAATREWYHPWETPAILVPIHAFKRPAQPKGTAYLAIPWCREAAACVQT